MAERDRPGTAGVLWDALRTIMAAMKAYLVPDNPATGRDFAAAAIEIGDLFPCGLLSRISMQILDSSISLFRRLLQPMSQEREVVTIAVLRAAEAMGLAANCLSAVIGLSEPTISRMKAGAFVLGDKSKPYELAVLLIRLFRSLDAIVDGDAGVLRQWLANPNTVLGGRPIEKLETISGLTDVLAYLDARRALV